jgi:hypothetical protein
MLFSGPSIFNQMCEKRQKPGRFSPIWLRYALIFGDLLSIDPLNAKSSENITTRLVGSQWEMPNQLCFSAAVCGKLFGLTLPTEETIWIGRRFAS